MDASAAVSAGDVLAAQSLATDLGTDQPLEHGLLTGAGGAHVGAEGGSRPGSP